MRAIFCCVMTLASAEFLNHENNRQRGSHLGPNRGGFFAKASGNIYAAINQPETPELPVI
jgi:hypothetical protein